MTTFKSDPEHWAWRRVPKPAKASMADKSSIFFIAKGLRDYFFLRYRFSHEDAYHELNHPGGKVIQEGIVKGC